MIVPKKAAFLLIGRKEELKRIRENVAKGRHTLLEGRIGIGKSHLLRYLEKSLKRAVYVERIYPLKAALLDILKHLHQHGRLKSPPDGGRDWETLSRKFTRLHVKSLAEFVVKQMKGRRYILLLDQLEAVTPAITATLNQLLSSALVIGAASKLKEAHRKVWWAFDLIELPPLTREESLELLYQIIGGEPVENREMFENKVLTQADGNPHAVVEMARQAGAEERVTPQFIRGLRHPAGVKYLDITPLLLLVGTCVVAARFFAMGIDNTDLYILAGIGGAFFIFFRYFIYKGMRG